MYEDADKIFNFLPIRVNEVEAAYIDHLWNAFSSLALSERSGKAFSIMPFHLLYMLAVQFKVLRISKEMKNEYGLMFTIKFMQTNQKDVLSPDSPFTIALLKENEIVDSLKLIGLEKSEIGRIKSLICNRNDNFAHAKGGIEQDVEGRITEYISTFKSIQNRIIILNDCIAEEWRSEFTSDDELNTFIESRLLDKKLCRADFLDGKLKDYFGEYVSDN